MSRFLKYTLPLGILALSLVVFIALVLIGRAQTPERKEEARQALLVDVIEAEERDVTFTIRSQGTVRPRTETTLVAQVSGRISAVSPDFVAGGFFEAGQVLLEIDPSDYETAVKRAEANLASQRARLTDEQARSEQALRDWRNLGRTGEPSDLVLRKPQVQEATAAVQAAQADLEKARRDLERTRVTVPYDGLVRQKLADIGQFVAPGTSLGVTFAIDVAEIRLPISTDDVVYLDLPSPTDSEEDFPRVLLLEEQSGQLNTWEGRIVRTEGVVDETSRVIHAVAQVPDPYGVLGESDQDELKVGTFVRAEIEGRSAGEVVVLPRRALRGEDTVLVANEARELEVRSVKLIRSEPHEVYISSGVEGGDLVVTTTLEAPVPGTRLTLTSDQPELEPADPESSDAVAGLVTDKK